MNADRLDTYLEHMGFARCEHEGPGVAVQSTNGWEDHRWAFVWHALGEQVALRAAKQERGDKAWTDAGDMEGFADQLLAQAMDRHASDIHLEPDESGLRVRFRQDGRLVQGRDVDRDRKGSLIAHLKIRAGMDIAEKRRPQDGRIAFEQNGKRIDLRVSTIPTQHGEKMVLRLLDHSGMALDLTSLGLQETDRVLVERAIHAAFGMVLVTGPTGSGKTTTLYSCLRTIQSVDLNIVTVEDPVEYQITGISQTQVRPEIDVTFAGALRTFLRQDPNVIMVGEIRDQETAELAVRASLTGHLVLSTLHTNDACSALPRLWDMGVQKHLLASSLKLVIAQRLLRVLCGSCRQPQSIAIPEPLTSMVTREAYAAVGCDACYQTGYTGRRGVYELLAIEEPIRALMHQSVSAAELQKAARSLGLVPLVQGAASLIDQGVTSVEEVMREVVA